MNSCPSGQIKRKSYITKNGIKVNSICIKDRGYPGHGPKTLPPIDKNLSLTKFGYNLHNNDNIRHKALIEASKKYSILSVLQRINLIRNYSKSTPINYDILTKDLDYLKKLYKSSKKVNINDKKSSKK